MTTPDTSVVVAAFATWHVAHRRAQRALDTTSRLIAYCAVESYAVLTRLPFPHRVPTSVASDFLGTRFERPYYVLEANGIADLVSQLPLLGISGGASYDALIAMTARAAGATLLTLDERAAHTYARCDVDVELLGV